MRNIAGRVRVIRSSRSAVRSRTHADAPSGVRREYSRTNATKIACAISPATEDKNGVPAACERVRVVMETTASWQAEGIKAGGATSIRATGPPEGSSRPRMRRMAARSPPDKSCSPRDDAVDLLLKFPGMGGRSREGITSSLNLTIGCARTMSVRAEVRYDMIAVRSSLSIGGTFWLTRRSL